MTRLGTERLLEEAARRVAAAARPAEPGDAPDAPRRLDPRELIERLRPFQSPN